jgi:broad specificity phosphatase PhoE
MRGDLLFITHPAVVIDPAVAVPRWHLSEAGIAQMRAGLATGAYDGVTGIVASTEAKAIEAAGLLAARLGLPVAVDTRLDENDRSATGYLPHDQFQRMADAFFATPNESVRGWERAIDAQVRAVAGIEAALSTLQSGDLAIVAHGGVGTLAYCHFAGLPITRSHDQPAQGHVWRMAMATRSIVHGWRPIEALAS